MQVKVTQQEISGHLDCGVTQAGAHWLNPYASFKAPRTSDGTWIQAATLGTLFHFTPQSKAYWVRYHSDLTLTPLFDGHKRPDRPEVTIKQNFQVGWRQFLFGAHETWNFKKGHSRWTRLAGAITEEKYNAFVEVSLLDPLDISLATVGGWVKPIPEAKVYGQATRDLNSKAWELGVGVDATHSSGLGLKLGYFHGQKIASVVSFKLNKYFSGSLLFDVTECNCRSCSERAKQTRKITLLGELS